MKPWETLGEAPAPGGGTLRLQRRDTEWVIRVDGHVLMTSRAHASERALAEVALEHVRGRAAPRIVIGGLGLGFTLRAVLDGAPRDARVTVAEISAAIVDWNRTVLRELTGDALADPRVSIQVGDVAAVIRGARGLDAILLDVDNGPSALSRSENRALYGTTALRAARRALADDGLYVVWSAGYDEPFSKRMREAGLVVRTKSVVSGGARHVLFLGTPARTGSFRDGA